MANAGHPIASLLHALHKLVCVQALLAGVLEVPAQQLPVSCGTKPGIKAEVNQAGLLFAGAPKVCNPDLALCMCGPLISDAWGDKESLKTSLSSCTSS